MASMQGTKTAKRDEWLATEPTRAACRDGVPGVQASATALVPSTVPA